MSETVNEWRRGWRTVVGCAMGVAAGISLHGNTHGLFIKPLAADMHWSRGQVSLSSTATLVTAFAMPWIGAMVDRVGPRIFVLIGAVLFPLIYLSLSAMPGPFWIYLAIMVFMGLTAGPATSPMVFARPLVGAFHRGRGLALALGISGNVLAAIFVLPVLQGVIAHHGWRAGYVMMAPISLVLGLGSWLLLGRSRVADPDRAATAVLPPKGEAGRVFLGVARDRRFWLLALSMVTISLAIAAFSSQLQPHLSDLGVPGPTAAAFGAWYAAMIVAGRVVCGALLDRFWPPGVAFITLILPVVGMAAFLVPQPPFWLLAAGGTLVAFSQGADADVLSFFVARYFGLKAFGLTVGVLGMASGVCLAAGAALSGYSFDKTGDYHLMLHAATALCVVSAAALLVSGLMQGRVHDAPDTADIEEAGLEAGL